MPTTTYDLIGGVTLSSSASNFIFSSIPSTYRDLALIYEWTGTAVGVEGRVRFNSDGGANYLHQYLSGDGAVATAATTTTSYIITDNASNVQGRLNRYEIFDYSVADKHKTVLCRQDRAGQTTTLQVARWANTSAINSIEIYTNSDQFAIGSSFYLYGVAA